MRKHSSKSVSFLMELLIVIFFFTIAASICVLVMTNAKDKSSYADHIKKALLYGQNLIETKDPILHQDAFQMDEQGDLVQQGIYQGDIKLKQKGTHGSIYTMTIKNQNQVLTVLDFFLEEAAR